MRKYIFLNSLNLFFSSFGSFFFIYEIRTRCVRGFVSTHPLQEEDSQIFGQFNKLPVKKYHILPFSRGARLKKHLKLATYHFIRINQRSRQNCQHFAFSLLMFFNRGPATFRIYLRGQL